MFVALGTRSTASVALTVMMLLARPLALVLMTIGLDGLRRISGGDDREEAMAGLAWQSPWRAVAFIVGGVAMAGFPLSLGFAARWGLFRLMVEDNFFQALLALSGSAGVMMGVIGAIRILLTQTPQRRRLARKDDAVVLILIIVLTGATLCWDFSHKRQFPGAANGRRIHIFRTLTGERGINDSKCRGPLAAAFIERDREVVSPSYTRGYPFVMARGEGTEVWDVTGCVTWTSPAAWP
jgi:NADH:ubiquinone oxidoreductase subunit 5 (subunit L)/multisubunit Na+/H+ antiporter MnhA subunit